MPIIMRRKSKTRKTKKLLYDRYWTFLFGGFHFSNFMFSMLDMISCMFMIMAFEVISLALAKNHHLHL